MDETKDNPDPERPPPKRRKRVNDISALNERFLTARPAISIRLSRSLAHKFTLKSPVFIEFEKLEYIHFNSDNTSYLYYLISSVFEISSKEFIILYTKDGQDEDDDSEVWEVVEPGNKICAGDYLIIFDNEDRTLLSLLEL